MITGQLVVEGSDDKHVVWTFCKKYKLKDNGKTTKRLRTLGDNNIGMAVWQPLFCLFSLLFAQPVFY